MGNHKETTQLYNLLNNLRSYVSHEGDLATLVGYSVLDSLVNFTSTSGNVQERKFEEIKAVYDGLERMTQKLENEEPYPVKCTYVQNVNDYLHSKDNDRQSTLLRGVNTAISESRRPLEEHMRRLGTAVLFNSERNGPSRGTRNCLCQDYQTIVSSIR